MRSPVCVFIRAVLRHLPLLLPEAIRHHLQYECGCRRAAVVGSHELQQRAPAGVLEWHHRFPWERGVDSSQLLGDTCGYGIQYVPRPARVLRGAATRNVFCLFFLFLIAALFHCLPVQDYNQDSVTACIFPASPSMASTDPRCIVAKEVGGLVLKSPVV
jgi:hypothetical protein